MIDLVASALLTVSLGAHAATTALALRRCRETDEAVPSNEQSPRVTIVRPVCGVDTYDALTLGSTFGLSYPDLRILFCCDREEDPAAALVRELIRRHPHVHAELLIGRDPLTANPKLNNILKSWPRIETDWVIFADSNVEMPPDYVQRLLAAWRPGTGVICAPPIGDRPEDFAGEIECAFLNTYQARWQYSSDSLGFGFAQGKTMLFRRHDLEAAGGLIALGEEVAEDAAATKVVRRMGLAARLVDRPFRQPLGPRTLLQVWKRQARWARLRRMTFPLLFASEIFTTSLLPMACAAIVADDIGIHPLAAVYGVGVFWYALEAFLSQQSGWVYSLRTTAAAVVRDVLLPAVWLQAWFIDNFEWRGNEVSAEEAASHS